MGMTCDHGTTYCAECADEFKELRAQLAKWVEIHENHASINARQAERVEALESQLADASAEIARLRKALLRVAGRNLEVTGMGEGRRWFVLDTIGRTEFDGTDASLIDVLCRLAEGE